MDNNKTKIRKKKPLINGALMTSACMMLGGMMITFVVMMNSISFAIKEHLDGIFDILTLIISFILYYYQARFIGAVFGADKPSIINKDTADKIMKYAGRCFLFNGILLFVCLMSTGEWEPQGYFGTGTSLLFFQLPGIIVKMIAFLGASDLKAKFHNSSK